MVRLPKLPPDEAFPQLQVVTDPDPMREVLQRELPGCADGRVHIDSVKIERFQYQPGQLCRICYSLAVRGEGVDPDRRQIWYGVLDSRGRARDRYQRELEQSHTDREFARDSAPPLHFLAELDMALWGFPNDPRLKLLHALVDRERFVELVQRNARAFGLPAGVRPGALDTRIAKWVPGSRCVLEHRLFGLAAPDAEPLLHVFSKTYRPPRGGPVFRTMEQLWGSEGRRAGALHMPEPLHFDPELHTIFQRPVPGEHAAQHLHAIDLPALAPQIGRLLAAIHQSKLDDLRSVSPEEELSDVFKARKMLGAALPEHAERIGRITAELRGRLPETFGLLATPVHGAFRLSQMLVADGRLYLLDFDGLLQGNPLSDAGSLAAHLLYLAVKRKLGLADSRSAVASFRRAYAEAAPWGAPEKIIKRAKKNRDESIAQLLDLTAAVLSGEEKLA
jgi:hypothetical protein